MEIRELFLKSYGKFDNHKIVLKPGINIIYGGNETGKSTIHSFIRAMFFGLNRGRGRAAKTDEYQIRLPWDRPEAFMGSMRIAENGEVYRIDRNFGKNGPPLSVTCETKAREYSQPENALESLLGGISETAFVNTVFIPQAQSETDEALAAELQRYMVNSDQTLDTQLDVSQALRILRKKKKLMEQKKKKEDEWMERCIEQKQASAEAIRNEIELLKRQMIDVPLKSMHREEDEEEEDGNVGLGRKVLEVLLFAAGICALAGAYFLTDWKLRIFLGIFGALFLAMILPVHFLLGDREDKEEGTSDENGKMQPYLMEEIRNREESYQKLQNELEKLYHSHVKLDGTDTEIAALTLAIDRICELSAGIYAESGGQLNERASIILKELTRGAYDRIILDETAEVRIHTPSRVLGLHQVSGGTLQQIYFALRMAAGDLLCKDVVLPVILDETFAMYDDARLEAALMWLKKSGRQVILFTCQKREREILERIERQSK